MVGDPDLSFTSALLTFEFERVPKTRVPASLERFWKRKNGPCRGEAGANIVFLLGTASDTSPLDGRLEIFCPQHTQRKHTLGTTTDKRSAFSCCNAF
jgi:hypothetical protein